MEPIENPKVFISYAWGTDEYQEKVLQFCARLQNECGLEVIVDKCALDAGNDTYDFMERCVKDPTVNFVIMLLEKNYAEKADARQGGVGTETQIISAKVYSDTAQSKFIPVVFERGENGEVYKPAYLNSRFHFDLTKENANDEFKRLVKHLYGQKAYTLPPRGTKPDWVSQPTVVSPIVSGSLFTINNATDEFVIKRELKKALNSIVENIFSVAITNEQERQFQAEPQEYLNYVDTFRPYRDAAVTILGQVAHKDFFEDCVADFFEEYKLRQDENRRVSAFLSQATGALLHEVFIYTIALLWNAEEYQKIKGLISRTYFIGGKYRSKMTARFIDVVYSGANVDLIENAKKKVDKKNYHSGLAQLWKEHIMSDFSLELITFADLLVHSLDIVDEPNQPWYWFPMLYVYVLPNPIFERFSAKLKSVRQIKRMQGLFSDPSPEDLRRRIQQMSTIHDRYRYSNAFERAPLIIDYTKPDEIGTLA